EFHGSGPYSLEVVPVRPFPDRRLPPPERQFAVPHISRSPNLAAFRANGTKKLQVEGENVRSA
ncbi:MAG: hypothetical protein ACK463_24590, partial [Bradyrhizobium sp.]